MELSCRVCRSRVSGCSSQEKQREAGHSKRRSPHLCYLLSGLFIAHCGFDIPSSCVPLVIAKLSMVHACSAKQAQMRGFRLLLSCTHLLTGFLTEPDCSAK